jgi:surfeit locus 1 family protein
MVARRRPLLVAALLLLVAALCALGVWQLQRRMWKLALIAHVEQRLAAPPVAAPGPDRWPRIGKDDAYTRVRVEGIWRPVKPVLTQATTQLGGGFWVMAPLDTNRGFTVLVNRGFVALEDKRDLTPPPGPVTVTVTGLLRLTEPRGGFLRSNVPAEGRWYSRDVAAIAQALCHPRAGGDPCLHRGAHRPDMAPSLGSHQSNTLMGALRWGDEGNAHRKQFAPYFIDADVTPGQPVPRGGMTVVRFPNNHLVYAFTWFGLAALIAFMTWRVTVRRVPE